MSINTGSRKIQQIRYSYVIPLPPMWIRALGLKKHDSVEIIINDDETLTIQKEQSY